MPYADPARQREYQRNWYRRRRASFFEGKTCVRCGAEEHLQLHHVNPEDKTDHRIWSWAEERRQAEIEKCEVLCEPCHIDHHQGEWDEEPYYV